MTVLPPFRGCFRWLVVDSGPERHRPPPAQSRPAIYHPTTAPPPASSSVCQAFPQHGVPTHNACAIIRTPPEMVYPHPTPCPLPTAERPHLHTETMPENMPPCQRGRGAICIAPEIFAEPPHHCPSHSTTGYLPHIYHTAGPPSCHYRIPGEMVLEAAACTEPQHAAFPCEPTFNRRLPKRHQPGVALPGLGIPLLHTVHDRRMPLPLQPFHLQSAFQVCCRGVQDPNNVVQWTIE